MKCRRSARLALLGGLVLAPPGIAEAGTVHGTVMNGTTGKPQPSSSQASVIPAAPAPMMHMAAGGMESTPYDELARSIENGSRGKVLRN